MTNEQILQIFKAATTTSTLSGGGLLSPEQAKTFLRQTFDATPLGGLIRHEIRRAKTGEIDKIGIASRILRKKTENNDDGYRVTPKTDKIEYSTTAVRIPWEITEETLRENIEGQNFEKIVTDLMTSQMGVDKEDLCLNGDTATPATFEDGGETKDTPDYDFLKINDGWIKLLLSGAHVEDRASKSSGAMSLDVYYDALKSIPNKYNNGKLRWLMSPHRKQEWERYILTQAVTNGGIVTDKRVENPAAIPVIEVPAMPDGNIILTDPKNLIEVNTYDVKLRKTTEGEKAIMMDKRFYAVHFDFDPVVEELDAAVIVKGLAAI